MDGSGRSIIHSAESEFLLPGRSDLSSGWCCRVAFVVVARTEAKRAMNELDCRNWLGELASGQKSRLPVLDECQGQPRPCPAGARASTSAVRKLT